MSAWTVVDTQRLDKLRQAGALILDCRFSLADTAQGRREYDQGHVPGAVHADLDHDLSAPRDDPGLGRHPLPSPAQLARRLQDWGWDGAQPVVAYDAGSGAIAARAWWLLRMADFEQVAVLDGGWTAWQEAGLPQATDTPQAANRALQISLRNDRLVDSSQLQSALQERSVLLLDARASERHAGHAEPIDPVAGHVPGALNRPFAQNLDVGGQFKNADVLRKEFEQLLSSWRPDQVVHMCGSGVTACHNLLAMEHAGLPGSRLYAPSWSGWISDPDRPVAGAQDDPE